MANPDADEEDLEKLQDNLSAVDEGISHVVDTIGYCIKAHHGAIVPVLAAELGPCVLKWLDIKDDYSIPLRTGAICLADDLLEFAGDAAGAVFPVAFPHLLEAAGSANAQLRHPAVYGLGLCAQFAGAVFA